MNEEPASPTPQLQSSPLPESPETLQDSTEEAETNSGWDIVKSILKAIINWLVIPAAIVLILHNFVFQAFHVVGLSMFPTLHDEDYLIISKVGGSWAKLARHPYLPARGQIVVFHYPKDPSLVFVKRAIGLPGDHVVVANGQVKIYNATHPDGFSPDQGFQIADPTTLGTFDDIVPAGNVFVMGDNRAPNGSFDSRDWGYLPSEYIIGDAILRLLPLSSATTLAPPTYK